MNKINVLISIVLILSGIIIYQNFFASDSEEANEVLTYEISYVSGDQVVGIIDSIVYIDDEPLSEKMSSPIISLFNFALENNKRYLCVNEKGQNRRLPKELAMSPDMALIKMKTQPIPGTDSLKLYYVPVRSDSLPYYFSQYDESVSAWVLTNLKPL